MNTHTTTSRPVSLLAVTTILATALMFSSAGIAADKPVALTPEQEALKQKVLQLSRDGAKNRRYVKHAEYSWSVEKWLKVYQSIAAPLITKYGTDEDKKIAADIATNAEKLLKEMTVANKKRADLFRSYNDTGHDSLQDPTNKKLYENAKKKLDAYNKVMDENGPIVEFNGLCFETWNRQVTDAINRMSNDKVATPAELDKFKIALNKMVAEIATSCLQYKTITFSEAAKIKKEGEQNPFVKVNNFGKTGGSMRDIDATGPLSPVGVEFLKNRAAEVEKSGRPLSAVEQQLLQKFAGMPVQVTK